jgi:hypothetical protein
MYKELAKRIPDRIRSQRLMIDADPIDSAYTTASNIHMQLLFDIYTQFLFPGKEEDINCKLCLNRIKNCFTEMKPFLIEIEKEYKLLNAIR